MRHLSYSPDLALSGLFVKRLPWEVSCQCGRCELKNGRSTKKTSKSTSSKAVLSSGNNVSIGILYQMESTLNVTEV